MTTISGGAKLAAKLAELSRKIEGKHSLRVGFLEGSRYQANYGRSASSPDVTAAQTAFWLNYGHTGTPPRPFFTDMVKAKSGGWGESLARILVANDFDVDNALDIMGEGISDQLREAIVTLDAPALSPVTLMLRQMLVDDPHLIISGATVGEAARRVDAGEAATSASTKVGVHSGHMLASVAHDVNHEG